ncbi:hypothetical protein [Salmonella phage S144]|uniref:Uncharacterized protein n=1 Tax=Salmonella phage S144 TaxID=2759179 RepID=A0A7G5CF36_9CAUD|nr:hypothetical protein [Salmonella phage S144]
MWCFGIFLFDILAGWQVIHNNTRSLKHHN